MKICYVITKADEIGGAQIHIRDLSKSLLKDGHTPVVITGEKGLLVDYLYEMGIEVYVVNDLQRSISIKKDIRALWKILKVLKRVKPDIVSLHSSKAGALGRIACALLNIKVIFTAHGWAFANGVDEKEKKKYIRIEKFLSRFANKIITVSKQDKNLAIKYKVASEHRQVVIHNGMYDLPIESERNLSERSSDICNLVMVARFSEQKDHKTLFKALEQLRNEKWHLHLIGKGPGLEENIKLVESLNLSNKITFLGERNDVDKYLLKMDIFLLIANWEGFPRSILEAMRSSLPIIASDVGGVSEAINDAINGYLIPRGDSDLLTERLKNLIQDKGLRASIGVRNRADYIKYFTFEAMYRKTLQLYLEVTK
ncbi:glycosyl transferase [Pseudoalteromonas sp. PS1M3]|uniref:glycosyltransferase family 4 protein n=1 Tax=Pseudoalteromonas sp. PS1M3 TaxID=87791 RepID=UPI0019505A64|nr:glycosyltransferase family 4 protein [Pseudoalteromonas sp. PS1M3]BBW90321.1 glycosyl transferase [Pseudoalteromonas sp. PS1M3]